LGVPSEAELPRPARRAPPPALVALLAPDAGMERQARAGGARLAFALALVCSLLVGFAQAVRIDARSATLEKLDKAGTLQTMSEKQLADEIKGAERLYQVGRVAWGAVEAPVFLLLLALAVVVLVWFMRGKMKGRAVFPVAAAALLPLAIANLLDAVAAFERDSLPLSSAVLSPRSFSAVLAVLGHPLAEPFSRLGNALDFFSLWGAILLGYGVAAAGDLPARRAVAVTLLGWVCWRLVLSVGLGG